MTYSGLFCSFVKLMSRARLGQVQELVNVSLKRSRQFRWTSSMVRGGQDFKLGEIWEKVSTSWRLKFIELSVSRSLE